MFKNLSAADAKTSLPERQHVFIMRWLYHLHHNRNLWSRYSLSLALTVTFSSQVYCFNS